MYVAARCHSVAYRTVALVTLPPTLRADLDSTFCAGIHHSKMALNNPGLLINLVAVAVFTTSAVAFLFLTFRVGTAPDPRGPWSCRLPESWRHLPRPAQVWRVLVTCGMKNQSMTDWLDQRGSRTTEARESAHPKSLEKETARHRNVRNALSEVSHWGVRTTFLNLFLLWAPVVVYLHILLPCWDCFDFEAAATHEVRSLPQSRTRTPDSEPASGHGDCRWATFSGSRTRMQSSRRRRPTCTRVSWPPTKACGP